METLDAVTAFAALAQETRLDVFRLLVRAGLDGLPAGAIAEQLGVPPPTLSFHLAHLTSAGLLESRRHGRFIFYCVHFDGVRDLLTYLTQDCCQGQPELCGEVMAATRCSTTPMRRKC
jgi:DNA-binding transcriptional ArsR family regulator